MAGLGCAGLGGFSFCFGIRFWHLGDGWRVLLFASAVLAGLGWAGLPLGLAGLGSPHARFRENSKRMKMQYEAKLTQFLFILLLRVYRNC